MRVEPQQLKMFMVDAGLIDEKRFEECEKKANEKGLKIEDVLISEGIISEDELLKLKAYILGIPFVNLENEIVDPQILKIIPESIARTHNIVAYKKKGKSLEVAMLNPEDLATIEFLKKTTSLKILPRLTTVQSIKNILRQYHESLATEFGEIIQKEAGEIKVVEKDKEKEGKDLEKMAQELPVVKIVNLLIKHAILQRASDIHIEPHEKEILVRYRIDGILRDVMVLPKNSGPAIVARIKILSNLRIDETRLPQDGRFKVETEDFKYSLRVSTLPVVEGEKVVMRLLPEGVKALTLGELGLFGKALEDVQLNIRKPIGMILVTGPTGSGKTTTLYSILQILNTPGVNISTIEDPVEYRMPRINQTQINPKIGLTFAAGLRTLLRQDPDIIMVGEIRDKETADLAVNAALTGHLVLSTLHTNSAAGAIPRLIEMGVEPFLISSTLNCVLAQRLVRKLHGDRGKYFLKETELDNIAHYCDPERILKILRDLKIAKPHQKLTEIPFYRPLPSKEAPDGYKGRIGIFEVLPITQTIKELITKEETADKIEEQAIKEGMLTMVEDGFIKAAQGITSIEEILRVIIE
jgi:type IV pilus assembly protein PilB